MKRIFIYLAFAALCCGCAGTSQPDIIPMPADLHMRAGSHVLPEQVKVGCQDSTLLGLADFIKVNLPAAACVDMTVSQEGNITYAIDPSLDPDGGYVLSVTRKGVSVKAGSYAGAVAATATLGQIAKGLELPCLKIEDTPRFAWRGFMLDVSRHFFTKEEVKALICKMAQYKFNKFHWHLTDDQGWRVEIKAYPELTSKGAYRDPLTHDHDIELARRVDADKDLTSVLPADRSVEVDGKTLYGGYYTQDDIREVVSYAASLGIDVIPEVDMPGHSLKIIESLPHLSCKGVASWGKDFSVPLCPGNDATLEFAKAVYGEIFGLFPFEYVHLGADEVEKSHWKSCPKCQARKAEFGLEDESDLQDWFVKEMEAFFHANGRTMIGWDEIAAKPELSRDAVVQWWRPWAPVTRQNAAENGNKLILSPNEFFYMDIEQNRNSLMKVYRHDPVDEALKPYEDQVLGIHGNLWCEYVASFEAAGHRYFPRMFAVSELNWSDPAVRDEDSFNHRVIEHLRKLDAEGWNYRIPDLDGICDLNVYVDSAVVNVVKAFDEVVVRYTTDGTVPGADSPEYTRPLVVSSDCTLKFRQFTSTGIAGETATAVFRAAEYAGPVQVKGLEQGLLVRWFNGSFSECAEIPQEGWVEELVAATVGYPVEPKNDIGLVFDGYVEIPEDGIWSFYAYTDDGSRMMIDGQVVVDNDGLHSRNEKTGQAALRKGMHPIRIEYFDQGGGMLEAGFVLEDGRREPFRPEQLWHKRRPNNHTLFMTEPTDTIPYRIPAIATLSNGSLMALTDYRYCKGDIGFGRVDIHGRTSSDNGATWGEEFTLIEGTGVSQAVDCGFGDAALVADRESGDVLVMLVCGETVYWKPTTNRQNPNRIAVVRSHDNGKTWEPWQEMTEQIYSLFDESGHGCIESCFIGSGKICQSRQVKVGSHYRLYAAMCARPNGNRVIYSDDFGRTWKPLGSIDELPALNGDEPKCEELPDGRVVLSSRVYGGRIFNIFSFTDIRKAEGSWGEAAFSGEENGGCTAVENACNGEILILPVIRKADNVKVHVAFQSVPLGPDRRHVGIYYKELPADASELTPALFAAGWEVPYQVSRHPSAYSTMVQQENGNIAFFYEECADICPGGFDMVYKEIPVGTVTSEKYEAVR